ncbi:hypothetical protein [Amycolatopsis sp.]|uniref:hypothetical protein n=1 Tax=Amycolatopsis sp. TaxID=37632 RepID=UPI002BAB993A|nr:hypothetical protein [Amycolatopsis sp.]HVV13691.1 hypothetical protein [Amycolatopsis sp.]HVW80405.1 hypothetical protein [Mycobacteriales bacterium]
MPDTKTDPHRLPSPSVAEAKQAQKAQFIPAWAMVGIALVIVAVVLLAVLG